MARSRRVARVALGGIVVAIVLLIVLATQRGIFDTRSPVTQLVPREDVRIRGSFLIHRVRKPHEFVKFVQSAEFISLVARSCPDYSDLSFGKRSRIEVCWMLWKRSPAIICFSASLRSEK